MNTRALDKKRQRRKESRDAFIAKHQDSQSVRVADRPFRPPKVIAEKGVKVDFDKRELQSTVPPKYQDTTGSYGSPSIFYDKHQTIVKPTPGKKLSAAKRKNVSLLATKIEVDNRENSAFNRVVDAYFSAFRTCEGSKFAYGSLPHCYGRVVEILQRYLNENFPDKQNWLLEECRKIRESTRRQVERGTWNPPNPSRMGKKWKGPLFLAGVRGKDLNKLLRELSPRFLR